MDVAVVAVGGGGGACDIGGLGGGEGDRGGEKEHPKKARFHLAVTRGDGNETAGWWGSAEGRSVTFQSRDIAVSLYGATPALLVSLSFVGALKT